MAKAARISVRVKSWHKHGEANGVPYRMHECAKTGTILRVETRPAPEQSTVCGFQGKAK